MGPDHQKVSASVDGWPLTLKSDSEIGLFLKFNMRHGACQHKTKYYRHDIGHSFIRHATLNHFKIDMQILKTSDRGHSHFLNSTCDIEYPRSRAPDRAGLLGCLCR